MANDNHEYVLNVMEHSKERIGEVINNMESGTKAEIVGDNGKFTLKKEHPESYTTVMRGCVNLWLSSEFGTKPPVYLKLISEAVEDYARDAWFDHRDYINDEGRWTRWMIYYPNGRDNGRVHEHTGEDAR